MFRGSSHCSTSPPSHEGFSLCVHTGLPTQGTFTEDLANTNQEDTTSLSNNTTSTQEVRQNNNHLYTQRDKALSQTTITSHKRDKTLSQTNHNHLYTRGMNTNPKYRKVTTLGDHEDHKHFGDHKDHKLIFPQK